MAKFNQGAFIPKHPEKYVGSHPIIYRSGWERTIMNLFDNHPNVEQWASESLEIPYISPFDGRWHRYIPDFFVVYLDKNGRKHGEVIEVKPANQTYPDLARGKRNQDALILNQAKWKYAVEWCKHQGVEFRIMTEEQIYQGTKSSKGSKPKKRKMK